VAPDDPLVALGSPVVTICPLALPVVTLRSPWWPQWLLVALWWPHGNLGGLVVTLLASVALVAPW